MEIFGLTPVQATILIVSVGVILQNVLGWLKSSESFDIKRTTASAIIAFVVGITVIGPQIEVLHHQMLTELSELIIAASLIASVAGFDTLTKNAIKAAEKRMHHERVNEKFS